MLTDCRFIGLRTTPVRPVAARAFFPRTNDGRSIPVFVRNIDWHPGLTRRKGIEVLRRPDMAKFKSNNEAARLGCETSLPEEEIAKRVSLINPDGSKNTFVISRYLEGCLELKKKAPAFQRPRRPKTRIWEAEAG